MGSHDTEGDGMESPYQTTEEMSRFWETTLKPALLALREMLDEEDSARREQKERKAR